MNLNLGLFSLTIKSGALIPLLIILPNLVWMLLPKEGSPAQRIVPIPLTVIENIGRAGILLLPFFYTLDLNRNYAPLALIGMGLMLLIYYACWLRFFASGSAPELLKAPFLAIPLPMAITPTLFLLLSAYLMGSWPMFGVSLLFGAAHIWVSALSL